MRTCVGCRRTTSPVDLLRIVRIDEATLDVGRTLPGRGAWLCRDSPACFDRALARRAFERSWRGPVSAEALRELRAALGRRGPATRT